MNIVDFRPVLDQIVFPTITLILAGVVPPLAGWAVYKVGQVAHITISTALANRVEAAMQNGVTLALGRAQQAADSAGSKVQVGSPQIATAANYVLSKVKPEMDALGITPESLSDRIEARILARVPTTPPAQSPPAAQAAAVTVESAVQP